MTDILTASPSAALGGDIKVPGDKSISHRALILSALAKGISHISGLLESDDVHRTEAAVQAFGASVERLGEGERRVTGAQWQSPGAPIDCGNSGTAARLLMGAAAGFPLTATFTGDASLSARPMSRVTQPLEMMGARFDGEETLPLTLHGGRLGGIAYDNVKSSAQVKSAILLAGLGSDAAVEVFEPLASRDHSERMLAAFGCDVAVLEEGQGRRVRLGTHRRLTATDVAVPGDPSSAAFPLVSALLVPGSALSVRDVLVNPLRTGLFAALERMGARIAHANRRTIGGEEVADLVVRHSTLSAIETMPEDAPAMIDEYPILAVAAAFASGTSRFHGLAELRVKESDRLAAIIAGLNACGVAALAESDSLIVPGCGGPPPGGATIAAHHDHRIAMAFLVMGLAAKSSVTVDSAPMIATSFPGFAGLMRGIGADIA